MKKYIINLLSIFVLVLTLLIGFSGCKSNTEQTTPLVVHICDHSGRSYDAEVEGYTTFEYSTVQLDLKDGTKIYTSIENCIIFRGECLLCKSED